MVVSNTGLTFTNSTTLEKVKWPFMYICNYGCCENVFFDTGPGCEKYYAFSTEKASDLYELVANINQGNLQDQAGNKKSNGTVPSSARPSMDGRRQFTKKPRKPSQSKIISQLPD